MTTGLKPLYSDIDQHSPQRNRKKQATLLDTLL